MAVVKGSKQEKMIVVPYRPGQAIIIRLGIVACMLFIATGAYFFGHNKGVYESADARIERDSLRVDLETYTQEANDLRQQLVSSEQAQVVNIQALDEVQEAILGLREQNAQLEEDVLFYKQVMSPENNEAGLVIGQLDLLEAEGVNRVRYRIEFKQLANNEAFIIGYANVNVMGKQDDHEVSMPLRSLSSSEGQLDIKLQFKYFQNIEGELELPEGFEPEKVQILAVAEGDNAKTVQKSFSWLIER